MQIVYTRKGRIAAAERAGQHTDVARRFMDRARETLPADTFSAILVAAHSNGSTSEFLCDTRKLTATAPRS